MAEFPAAYFDGVSPVRRKARVTLEPAGLAISHGESALQRWAFADARALDDIAGATRYGRFQGGADTGERLEVSNADANALLALELRAHAGEHADLRRDSGRIIFWSIAAAASLLLAAIFGVPALAARIAPLVPWRWEASLGRAIENEVIKTLANSDKYNFCEQPEGVAAFQKMLAALTARAALPGPVAVRVIDHGITNAFALPGGRVVFFRGLIDKAEKQEEISGVLAHELGHVAHRDTMQALIHAGGISFLIGTFLGDFTGSAGLILASKFLLGASFSRDNETAADTFGVGLINAAGGDAKALGAFLGRIAAMGKLERNLAMLLTHPVTDERVALIGRLARRDPLPPILTPEEWRALKAMCEK